MIQFAPNHMWASNLTADEAAMHMFLMCKGYRFPNINELTEANLIYIHLNTVSKTTKTFWTQQMIDEYPEYVHVQCANVVPIRDLTYD